MDNIKKVGFDIKDIKYILLSHGHLDHFGGAARIQEASGARVVALAEDWKMIEEVGSRPGRGGGPSPRVPKRDMVVKEGDTLTLGAHDEILSPSRAHAWCAVRRIHRL
jgi:metallo-beta-lactamase class B